MIKINNSYYLLSKDHHKFNKKNEKNYKYYLLWNQK